MATTKSFLDFTMGADPEFCLCRGTAVVKGNAEIGEGDEFGFDGNGVTFEARPDPSNHPLEIVHNIRGLFTRQVLKNPKFLAMQWLAGSHQKGYPLGGHIHFGINSSRINFKKACNILSQYVGAITVLIEDREQGKLRRKAANYGGIEDYREQAWGFEYRAPSSWITSPYVAAGVLCLAKAVMFEVLNNDKFKPSNRVLDKHFMEMDTDFLLKNFPDLWSEVTKLALYQPFKVYIDVLYYLVTHNQNWFPQTSMKQAWGVVDMKTSLSSKMQLDAIWSRFVQEQRAKEGKLILAQFGTIKNNKKTN